MARAERFWRIKKEKVEYLLKQKKVKEVDAVMGTSLLMLTPSANPETAGKRFRQRSKGECNSKPLFSLGYKLPLSIGFDRKLPLASIVKRA
jgi:hypothetical protein